MAIFRERFWFHALTIVLLPIGLLAEVNPTTQVVRQSPLASTTLEAWHQAENYTQWKKFSHAYEDLSHEWKTLSDPKMQGLICQQIEVTTLEHLLLLEDALANLPAWTCLDPIRQRIDNYWQERRRGLFEKNLKQKWSPQRPLDLSTVRAAASDSKLRQLPSTTYDVEVENGPVFFSADLPEKYVALTFDDGPHAQRTQQILDTLASFGSQVTFFTVGENAQRLPKVLQLSAQAGHSMGTHSQTHPQLTKLQLAQAQSEIVKGFSSSIDQLGFVAPFFRFPYGASNRNLQEFVTQQKWATFFWNIDTLDWKLKDPEKLLQHTLNTIAIERRGIILFHDIHRQTVEVVPWVLRWLTDNGYKTVLFKAPPQTSL